MGCTARKRPGIVAEAARWRRTEPTTHPTLRFAAPPSPCDGRRGSQARAGLPRPRRRLRFIEHDLRPAALRQPFQIVNVDGAIDGYHAGRLPPEPVIEAVTIRGHQT